MTSPLEKMTDRRYLIPLGVQVPIFRQTEYKANVTLIVNRITVSSCDLKK